MTKKRLTDCHKWADPWFMELPVEMKLLWIYLCDNCDNAGVWIVNHRLAEIQVGCPIEWPLALNVLEGRVSVIANGKKWWLAKFINFQNPNGLDENNAPQRQIVNSMRLHGIDCLPYLKSTLGGRVGRIETRDKDKDYTNPNANEVSSSGNEPAEKLAERRTIFLKFLKSNRLSASNDAVTELLGLAREHGCTNADMTMDMIEWSTVRARRAGKPEVRYARHIESEAKQWSETYGPKKSAAQ